MTPLRTSLLAIAAIMAVSASACASAASFQVWNVSTGTWSANGTVHLAGPISVTAVSGFSCSADFTMTVVNGSASITNVVLSGASICPAVATYLPWPATAAAAPYIGPNPPFTGAPTLSPTLWNVTLSAVRLSVPPPFSLNCPNSTPSGGPIVAVLDAATQSGPPVLNRLVFKHSLGPCLVQTRTNTAPNALVANLPIRVVP